MALPDDLPDGGDPAQRAESAARGGYRDFALSLLSWFGCWGMQGVLFSWLVVGELGAPAELVGTAHFSLILPGFVFLLVGGAAADRVDRRRLLLCMHLLSAAVIALLAFAVASGWLSLPMLIVYALIMGTIAAFAFPARDALLSEVAGANIMRAVTGVTLIQFVSLALGAGAAGVARFAGSPATLAFQAALVLAGALAVWRLPRVQHAPIARRAPLSLGELLEGIRVVLRSEQLRPVWLLTLGVGFFFQGPYWVVYPLLIRDVYGGDVAQLAALTATFPVGAVIGSLVLLRRGYLRRRVLALAVALALAALCLLAIALGISYPAALLAGLGWGLCGSVYLNAGRTVFQERAPPAQRARVLSAYTLCFYAAGSLGSPLAGFLAGAFGPLGAFGICGGGMLVFVALVSSSRAALRAE